jgi:hypothetical protein
MAYGRVWLYKKQKVIFFFKGRQQSSHFSIKMKNIYKNENWKEENENLQQCFTSIFKRKKNENESRRQGEARGVGAAVTMRWSLYRDGEAVRWWGGETVSVVKIWWRGVWQSWWWRRSVLVDGGRSQVAKVMVKMVDRELVRGKRRGTRGGGRLARRVWNLGGAYVLALSVFGISGESSETEG